MAKSKEWKKIEDGSMIDWDKQGVKPIEGKLISMDYRKSKPTKKGEKVREYQIFKVQTSKGVSVFTGSQLEQKLKGVKIGTEVRIVFTGKVKTANKFKVNTFDVFTR